MSGVLFTLTTGTMLESMLAVTKIEQEGRDVKLQRLYTIGEKLYELTCVFK